MEWKKKMRRIIPGFYAACVVMVFFFFLYLCANITNHAVHNQMDTSFFKFENYDLVHMEDESAPLGVRDVYTMEISDVSEGGSSLAFYSIHQNVEAYLEGECIYTLRPEETNGFGKTPGSNWNTILINFADAGKEVRVILTPVYESSRNIVPDFYVGSKYGIWGHILKEDFLAFVLSFVAIVIGLVFIFFTMSIYHTAEVDKSLIMLGMFSLNIGLWKITDMASMSLIFPFSAGQSAFSVPDAGSGSLYSVCEGTVFHQRQSDMVPALYSEHGSNGAVPDIAGKRNCRPEADPVDDPCNHGFSGAGVSCYVRAGTAYRGME